MGCHQQEIVQETIEEVSQAFEGFLEWSKDHKGCTLRELEDKAGRLREAIRVALEAGVAIQGEGNPTEGVVCSCGGKGVFQGYRERQVMTRFGPIRVRRAYFTCERCGQGIFPPGGAVGDVRGMERRGHRADSVDSASHLFLSRGIGGSG